MLENYYTCYPDGNNRGTPAKRGISFPETGWGALGITDHLPEVKWDTENKTYVWLNELFHRDRVGNTPVCIVSHFLNFTPSIQIALIKPGYWRPGLIREAYLLQRCNVNPEKVWRKMDDHRYREEITHSLNLLLALRRNGLEHEGYTSALGSWLERNK